MNHTKETQEPINDILTPQQELFCRFYTQNEYLFSNATLSYAEAYGYKLDTLSKVRPQPKKGKKAIEKSEYELAYDVCASNASRLLKNVKIQNRITDCLNELMNDRFVDSQLAKVISQDGKSDSKVAAIREYNKLKQRIVEKATIDHTTKGEKIITGMNIINEIVNSTQVVSTNEDSGNPEV